ncbi:alkaline phosphatase family protein [Paraburkholderia caballeronis]|uniref:alkaline phosphatase family protein n=1 Tax=Paraburkholderia caballeronis TaxID=416943 RepID=UPI0010662A29|nr:alkaline phosphatase family protein [Paraburkholderia caballeronis]TDV19579.1 phospholipase C [Paraburkholderia caballeronis]TDV22179.1 phospholipase C [Paraburkholderia caballeronis]TDV29083.1 phospholipase C [Paraburkholderia caballeronis]
MTTCTRWVDKFVITCADWTNEVSEACTSWADEGAYQCSQWADEGSNQCSQWADEGSNQCSAWDECHWYTPWDCIAGFFCKAWYWVANWVCQAWYWVANWVCQGWYWVAKWVCKGFAWVVNAVCIVFSWALRLVCVAWDTLRCALLASGRWLGSLTGRAGRGKTPPPRIERVFVLTLENRSFDHLFGFSGITGVDPQGNPTTFNEGFDPAVNSNVDPVTNANVFVSAPADFFLKGVDADPGHEFEDTLAALGGSGAAYQPVPGGYPPIDNSGFIDNYHAPRDGESTPSSTPDRIMHCFAAGQLPVLNALAREFAVCDCWFSSLPGPTWPNRFFQLAATSGGLDDSPGKLDVVTSTTVDGYRFENGNVFDLLDQYCIEWKIFEGDDFPVSFALEGMNLNELQGRFASMDDFESDLGSAGFGPKFVFIEPKYGAHEFDATGPGDFTCGNSMHPLDDVRRGEKLVKRVYEGLRNSPLWEKSVLLITFDEHGGFYDHVAPPPAAPPGDQIDPNYVKQGFLFDQLGVRVPAIVVSPLVPRNVIDHTRYDHTSLLASMERLFGMKPLTARDAAANDFLHLLSLAAPRADAPATLPAPDDSRPQLACEGDDDTDSQSADRLLQQRSTLRLARREGRYMARAVADYRLKPSQVGFMQVALLKVLNRTTQPDKARWLDAYRGVQTGIDAAIFMTDAKLKVKHRIDVVQMERLAARRR